MKAVFVHDHVFVTDSVSFYSDRFPYHIWQRYLDIFEELHIFSRYERRSAFEGLSESSGEGVHFHTAKNISSVRSFFGVRQMERQRLKNLISDSDVVISRLPSEYGLMAASIANELKKPYVIEVVGCAWDALWNYGGIVPKLYAPALTMRMKIAVRKARYVSYVSQEFLQARYPTARSGRTVSVSNVELPSLNEGVLLNRLSRLETSSNGITFGLIGSLKNRYKGVHTAIEALSMIAVNTPNVRLRVLGSGDQKPYIEMAAKYGLQDKVSFDGVLPSGQAVFEWLDGVDIYLQPSFQEGVPRALIEAMGRACPAIASTAGGIPELLKSDSLFPPGRAKALAKLMEKYIHDKALLVHQSSRNFEVAKSYDKATLDKRRLDFFTTFKNAASEALN